MNDKGGREGTTGPQPYTTAWDGHTLGHHRVLGSKEVLRWRIHVGKRLADGNHIGWTPLALRRQRFKGSLPQQPLRLPRREFTFAAKRVHFVADGKKRLLHYNSSGGGREWVGGGEDGEKKERPAISS